MELEFNEQRLSTLEYYTSLEFSISPQIFQEYMILLVQKSQQHRIHSIIQTYYEHLTSIVIKNGSQELLKIDEILSNKKIKSLFKLISIALQYIEMTEKRLSHFFPDSRILCYILDYMILNNSTDIQRLNTLKYAVQIKHVLSSPPDDSDETQNKINVKQIVAINFENFEQFLVHADTLYLLIQYLFLQEEYEQVKQIIDTFELCSMQLSQHYNESNQSQFVGEFFNFNAEKLKIVRQLVDENIMSPVTQASEDEQIQRFSKRRQQFYEEDEKEKKKDKKQQKQYLVNTDQSILQMSMEKLQAISSQPNMIVDYLNYLLDDSVRFFNKDSFNVFKMSLQYAHKTPDYYIFDYIGKLNVDPSMDPRQAISIFEQNMPTSIDILLQPNSYKIMVVLLIERSEQFRVRIEKDKLNIDLFNFSYVQQKILTEAIKINNLISFDLGVLINHCLNKKNQIGNQRELQVWVTNLQIVLYVLFGQLHLTHHNILKNKGLENKDQLQGAKIILRCINQVFEVLQEEDMLDVIRDFIESTCTRYYLDTIQAVLMKEENYSDPIIFNSIHSFLNQYFIDFQLSCRLKNYFLKLAFQREKQLISITIRQFHLPIDQIEIKYSKLYKKQIPYYFKQKKYLKSIAQTLKYFLGYQSPVSVHKRVYLAEQQIIVLMFKNFVEIRDYIKNHNTQMACLIVSQFIDDRSLIESHIYDIFNQPPFEFLRNDTEYLVDANLISRFAKYLKVNNASNEKLSFMINRMKDGDSYLCENETLKQNIKEKYFKMYLNYLREMIND